MSSSTAPSSVTPMHDSDRPVPRPAAQFDRLLQECRQLAVSHLADAIAAMLDKGEGALRELATASTEREARDLYLKTRENLLSQRPAIHDGFLEHYGNEFDRRARPDAAPGQQFSQYDLSSLELGLVEDDDLEETLKVNDMAAKLRRYCEEELAALDQRVGVLVGDANLQAERNPLSPQAICFAFKQTCREVESDLKVRMVLHNLFDDHVLDAVRSIYKEVNALLVQRAILPKIRYGAPRRGASGAVASGPDSAAAGNGGERDLFGMLQNLLTVNSGALLSAQGGIVARGMSPYQPAADGVSIPGFPPIASGGAAPGMLQGADLLSSLTRIQHGDVSAVADGGLPLASTLVLPGGTANVLRELKQTNVGSGMGQMDAMTLDIVAMLFDEIFDDDKIPVAMKSLIGRLQIPTLKVAILDKTFFSRRDHPARLLLDSLGEAGLGLPAEFNQDSPLYREIEAVLQKLIEGFREEIGIFDELRVELERVIAEQNRLAEEEAARLAKSIDEKERLSVARAAAQSEIRQRMQSGKLPRSVLKFLAEQWVKLLLVAHVKNGPDSDLWKTAVGTMDLLLWSVNPSKSLDERRELAKKLPGLLKRLNAGMQLIRMDDAARRQFFARLMRCHTQIINGTDAKATDARASPAAGPTAPATVVPTAQVPEDKVEPAWQQSAAKPAAVSEPPASGASAPKPEAAAPTAPPGAATPAVAKPQPGSQLPATTKAGAPTAQPATPVVAAKASTPSSPSSPPPPTSAAPQPAPAPATAPPRDSAAPATASPGRSSASTSPLRLPERSEAAEEEDASLDFTEMAKAQFSAVVIQNPFGDGQIEVEEINLSELPSHAGAATAGAAAGQGDEYQRLAASLQENTWLEFRSEQDKWASARLSYISPLKGTYLFVNRQGRKTGEYSLHQLARELRSGRAAVLDNVPLFDRAMTSLVGVLKGGAATP